MFPFDKSSGVGAPAEARNRTEAVTGASDISPRSEAQSSSSTADTSAPRSGVPVRASSKNYEAYTAAHRSSRGEFSPFDYFFAAEPPPPNVATAGLRVRQFVKPLLEKEHLRDVRVAIVTAGGTDVPLERAAVRYITNTSTGRRGAGLCEQFLRMGFYVIFLTSVRAVQPFVRHLLPAHPMPHILDFISLEGIQQKPQQQSQQEEQQEEDEEQQGETRDQGQYQGQLEEQPVASEGEVAVPPAAETSRRLATQASRDAPSPSAVRAVGSLHSDGGSTLGVESEAAEARSGVSTDLPQEDREQQVVPEGPWRVALSEPRRQDSTPSQQFDEELDAMGWQLDPAEAAAAVDVYKKSRERLLCITYQTLVEYSFLLRAIVAGASSLRERLMVCSAAAVADFYIPHALMAQHKLRVPYQKQQTGGSPALETAGNEPAEPPLKESSTVEIQGPSRSLSAAESSHPKRWFGSLSAGEEQRVTNEAAAIVYAEQQQQLQRHQHLTLRLHVVPKMILMVRTVAPSCFLAVFKLETDESKLERRAMSYIEDAGAPGVADCVVGNTLQTRGSQVTLYTRDGSKEVKYKHKPNPSFLGHGTIEAKLARYLYKLQSFKLKEALI